MSVRIYTTSLKFVNQCKKKVILNLKTINYEKDSYD